MGNPYVEVFRTYIGRLFSSWAVSLFMFVTLIWMAISLMTPQTPQKSPFIAISPFVGMAAFFQALVLWAHFQEQINSDMLWPNHLRPHVFVFTVISGALIVGWPLAVDMLHGVTSVGLMVLTTSIFALVGWYAATGWGPIILPAVALSLAMLSPSAATMVFGGQNKHFLDGVLAAAVVASVSAVLRIIRLTKNESGHTAAIQFDAWSLRPRMTGEINRARSRQRGLFPPKSRFYIPTGSGLWERARRWRWLNQGTVSFTLFFATLMFVGTMVTMVAFGGQRAAVQSLLSSPAILAVVMPPLMIPLSWLNLWRFLEIDSLRPIDRVSFLKEIGLAVAVQTFQCWSILAGSFFLLHAWANQWNVNLLSMTAFLAFWLGATACGLAITFWIMRYRSLPYALLCSFVPASTFVSEIITQAQGTNNRPLMIIGAVVFLLLGVLITRGSYHKWMVMELG